MINMVVKVVLIILLVAFSMLAGACCLAMCAVAKKSDYFPHKQEPEEAETEEAEKQ